MNPILVLPSEKYKESFLAAVTEQPADQKISRLEGNNEFNAYTGDFAEFLKNLEKERDGKDLPGDRVQQAVYWLVKGDKFIGRVAIRPSERHKGYGSLALKLVLPKAHELGIEKALLTCLKTNEASRRIIEKNGGIFENEVVNDAGTTSLRFWVPTS